MFEKSALDSLFGELGECFGDSPEYDLLLRDAHLGIALSDAGREVCGQIDARVVKLIEKHRVND